jgi:hypothetical protein
MVLGNDDGAVLLTNGRRGEMDKSGPAFPYEGGLGDGLTKRELFAGLAMAGELAAQSEVDGVWDEKGKQMLAARCVMFAGALIAELAKEEGA